ncbi:MAG TPA: YdeI/OmpD-associated family protein, partial [Flavitalea sp.]|nr:YdeI/OmpD-associated family protein [Flavitalea sp.]
MITYNAIVKRFKQQGEKTGWTYITIPEAIAIQIKPGTRKSFRVKGKIDDIKIEKQSLLPMGNGDFILALKKELRKNIGKAVGATVKVQLTEDKRDVEIFPELIACLHDEPDAYKAFIKLPPSHQRYYSKWVS